MSWGGIFVADSFLGRAGSYSRPIIPRSSSGYWPISPMTLHSSTHSVQAGTFIGRRRQSFSACRWTRLCRDEGTREDINFATIYGQGAHALSRQLRIEFAEARAFIAAYFERFQGIRRYLDSMVEFARENGYVQTIFGRRRYIPELRDRNFNVRAFGERTAANSPIQGSAADLIKIAMIRIDHALRGTHCARGCCCRSMTTSFSRRPGGYRTVTEICKARWNERGAFVPLVVDIGVGDNCWNEGVPFGPRR